MPLPSFGPRDTLLHRALIRVRPAPLAETLKRAFGIRRRVLATDRGRFLVDPVTVFALEVVRTGTYEPELLTILDTHLRPGSTFVDLGANEGYFSVVAGRLVGDTGRVVAVEPQPRLIPVLQANLDLNRLDNVHVVQAAVAAHKGTRVIHLAASTNSGSSGFFRRTRYGLPTVEVTALTLGELLDEAGVTSVDLLKIDVEGAEHEVLLGGREVLAAGRVRAVTLDVHHDTLNAQGVDPESTREILRAAGFRRQPTDTVDLWVRGEPS